jgi:O-antigen/teichoic acid export membrane protein
MANLLVVIWYSRHLPLAAYGNYQHFWIQLNVIYPLACFGIHLLIITYSQGFVLNLLRRINARQYALYALWVIALSAVFALLQCNALDITFIIPFLFLLAFSLSVILESFLIVFRNYAALTIINILYSAAYWLIHFYVLKQGFSLQALFMYLLAVTAIRLCFYLVMAVRNIKQNKGAAFTEDVNITRTRHLWLHLGLYDVLQMLFSWIDKFIISLVLAAGLSAVYFNGSQNIPFLPLLLSAAGSAVLMQLATGRHKDEQESIIDLMNQSGRVLSCIVFPVFFFLFFFRQELIVTLLSDKYIPAIPVFAVSLLVLPVKAYSFTTVLQRLHKGGVINTGAIADLIFACALMYPLYQWMGLPGVAMSFVITTYLQAGFYLFYAAKLLKTSPLKLIPYLNWLIKLIVFATVFIIIRYVGNVYFTGKIALILGGAVMSALIVASLSVEMARQKKYGGI